MSKTNPARGMRDFLPADVRKRNYVINIIKEVYESYGFEPLETPAVENLETLMGKYGEEGNQLIFRILKRGEKLDLENAKSQNDLSDLALRYDLTVPLARVVANNKNELPKFFKRYQIQPVWRADRPARGRFREFYQCDVDAIGSTSMVVEAEIISAACDILIRLGFKDVAVLLNHRDVLFGILDVASIPTEKQLDVLTSLDKLDKVGPEKVAEELIGRGVFSLPDANRFVDLVWSDVKIHVFPPADVPQSVEQQREQIFAQNIFLLNKFEKLLAKSEKGLAGIRSLKRTVELIGPRLPARISFHPSLARGLSYYTGTIIEFGLDKQDFTGSIGGGGRYDGLIGMFGKEQIPACGFSLGLERILVVMNEREMFPPDIAALPPADVLVTVLGEDGVATSLGHAAGLREEGLRALLYPEPNDKLSKQIKYADLLKIPQVTISGPDEQSRNIINIKDLDLGQQSEVSPPTELNERRSLSTKERRFQESELFHEFTVLCDLPIDLESVIHEKYPKPDFSCTVGAEKSYFEIKLISNRKNAGNIIRDSLARAFFTPDGIPILVFCFMVDSAAHNIEDYRKLAMVSDFPSFPYWAGVFVYERTRKEVIELVSPRPL